MKKKTVTERRKRKNSVKRPSRLEMVTLETMQDYAHAGTDTITRYRIVVSCQYNTVENQISDLIKTLAEARAERSRVTAILQGLDNVVAKR